MKLTKNIFGCSGKEIHPRVYKAGEECPADLLEAAVDQGALSAKDTEAATKVIADERAKAEPASAAANDEQA